MKPIHPIVVHFPIALLVFSVAADLAGFFADIESLRSAGWWALVSAALGAIATVAAGIFDMRRADLHEEVHHRVHRHMRVGFILLGAIIGLTVWRWRIHVAPSAAVPMYYLDLAVLTVALAAFQGWLGGELVYRDGVFVKQDEKLDPHASESGEAGGHSHQH